MKNILKYKEFIATVHFSTEDEVFYGKIEGINDLVTFEGSTVSELKNAYQEAVDGYIDLCHQLSKPAEKSYKGSFNIRISQDLHRKASQSATMEGLTLNQFVKKAIERECRAVSEDTLEYR